MPQVLIGLDTRWRVLSDGPMHHRRSVAADHAARLTPAPLTFQISTDGGTYNDVHLDGFEVGASGRSSSAVIAA